MPVFQEGELGRQGGRPRDPDVGVPPMPEFRIPSHVLVAHVVAADPGGVAVHDNDLAVVAEVDLKAIAGALPGMEVQHLDPGFAKLFDVALG